MNTSQPQDSLRKKVKKFKKNRKKVEKERSKNGDSIVGPAPLAAPGKLSIRPPQSKNCSAVPVMWERKCIVKI